MSESRDQLPDENGGDSADGKRGAARNDKRPGAGAAAAKTETLLRALAEKDRQLRDLTEQSLGFLEELAEANRRGRTHQALAQRIEELERLLGDAKRRLRTTGGCVLRDGSDGGVAPAVEVVFWQADPAAAVEFAKSAPGAAVTWVGSPDAVPEHAGKDDLVQWIASRDTRTPAQCWNLAMESTRAPAILFLAPGARIEGSLRLPASTGDASVAIAQPLCRRGTSTSLGGREDGLLHVREQPAPADAAAIDVVFASPDAFLVLRTPFETVGLFDEALLSPLALADYSLRAQLRGFRVLGIPQLEVRLEGKERSGKEQELARDRLLVLAAHRPLLLGKALANAPVLWELEPDAVAALLAELFARLPAAEGTRTKELFGSIAGALVANAAPAARMAADLHAKRVAWLRTLAAHVPPALRDEVQAELQQLEGMQPDLLPQALAGLAASDAFELRLWQKVEPLEPLQRELAAARAQLAQAQHELAQKHQQFVQMRAEHDLADRHFQAEREAADRRTKVLEQELEVIAQAIGILGQPQFGEVRQRLLALRDDANLLAQTISAAGVPNPGALIQLLYDVRARLADGNQVLGERNKWIGLLLREVTKRRVFPRQLSPHEVAFLQQLGNSQ